MEATWLPLGVLSTANGNSQCSSPSVPGGPLDIYRALGEAPNAHRPFVEIRVTLTPDSSATMLPELDKWSLAYSCLDAF